ncbi:MAG: hypothetical protein II045_02455 [Oscillospiraceae bacterium]|jgi:hypothetical protein|nr:hypothetical protein [Oscillospiraceae bacterium]MBQ1805225.1 hypothetical protein [Oscillospiraceae bacterium]MBQ1834588.1 hypothetical protein [Oscillospiraceae bacterium]MBQ2323999.1 hypothetical protein [Oscillospiraceae bacterium]MBQ2607408.1 hypothetical protein [Oscillospiraceae bacterium]
MSPKELMYVEDALSHAQFLTAQCRSAAQELTDPKLRTHVQQLISQNEQCFGKFYDLV